MNENKKEELIIPLYKNDMITAKENGEMADWRISFNESRNCAKAIDKALNDNFADNYLDTDKTFDTVVDEYGAERVTHIIAAQVVNHDWDGRYHNDVKTWAREQTKELSAEFMEDSRKYYLNAHPILIDGLATTIMRKEKEKELANRLVEESNIANEKRHEEYSDAFFVDNERKCIVWMYYNPDSNAGGQYVTNIISFDKLAKISSVNRIVDDYFNTQISSLCTQYLSDIGTDDYAAAERMFYDNPDFVNTTYTTMQALAKIALTDEWENELHNDLPSFIKTAFAWDELVGYGSIEEKIANGANSVNVVRDFFLKEKGTMYFYEGEYTDCIWKLEERDGKPVINIAVKRENESKPLFSFNKTFEWKDIVIAVTNRIQQEKIYNKLVKHCYKFSKYHTDDYRVYDSKEGRTVVRGSAERIKQGFGKFLNKQEVKMLIETEIVPALAKADEDYELNRENEDMEI